MVGHLNQSNTIACTGTVKFLCSYGGIILPRQTDGKLRYVGGDTRVIAVDRSIPFAELLVKLGDLCGSPVSHLRCQLPTEDLDALVSITSDEELASLIEEYDIMSQATLVSLKIRAFLSYPKSPRSSSKSISPITSASSSPSASVSGTSMHVHQHVHRVEKARYHNQACHPRQQMYLVHNGNHWP